MATVDVPWDWFVFRIETYQYIVKVTKFELPTAYHFSKAEGRTSLWADSPPPPACLELKSLLNYLENSPSWGYITIIPQDKSRSPSHCEVTNYILLFLKKRVVKSCEITESA